MKCIKCDEPAKYLVSGESLCKKHRDLVMFYRKMLGALTFGIPKNEAR